MVSHVFHMFSLIFRMFSWTNLLTRCPVPVSIFCCFCILEKFLKKYSRNGLKSTEISFYPEQRQRPKDTRRGALGSRGGAGGSQGLTRHGSRLGHALCPPGPLRLSFGLLHSGQKIISVIFQDIWRNFSLELF